ncbi:hypothetical protein HKD37_15G043533 [Glycine soja]
MTRGNLGDLQPFDPEIDRTFHRLVRHSVHPNDSVHFEHCEHFENSEYSVASDYEYSDFEHSTTTFHTENMAQPPPRERTLRDINAPDFTYESLCIQYPDEGVSYVLKTRLIHLLPKFHGLAGEDPCRNVPFCGRAKARLTGALSQGGKDARSHNQRLFVENVGKTEGNRSK